MTPAEAHGGLTVRCITTCVRPASAEALVPSFEVETLLCAGMFAEIVLNEDG